MPTKKKQKTLRELISALPKDESDALEVIHKPIAIGYCRVSTNIQVETGISLDTQKRDIEAFAQYKKLETKIFSDDGISGAQYENRPGLVEALSKLKTGDFFIVASLSRLSRSVIDALQINEVIEERKANLVVLDIQLDMSTPSGRMLFTVVMSINQMERENISQKVSHNMRNLSAQGKLKGKPPFGWKSPGKGLDFVYNEEEQNAIRQIIKFVNEDPRMTLSRLCQMMDLTIYKCRKAKAWHPATMQTILRQNNIKLGEHNKNIRLY